MARDRPLKMGKDVCGQRGVAAMSWLPLMGKGDSRDETMARFIWRGELRSTKTEQSREGLGLRMIAVPSSKSPAIVHLESSFPTFPSVNHSDT